MIDVTAISRQVLRNDIHRWNRIVDESIALHELRSTQCAELVPKTEQQVVALRKLGQKLMFKLIIFSALRFPCVLDLCNALIVLLNRVCERCLAALHLLEVIPVGSTASTLFLEQLRQLARLETC
jgi:hypothetical protein